MAYANKDNPDCANCNKSGLAILPVRYAVVPMQVDAALPATLGNKVVDVELKYHKYALRTLRQGFFYLFYEKHARGRHIKWEVYSVSTAGTLWKQFSIDAIEVVEGERCSRREHRVPASIIAIESPEKCGKVWMAFSEHAWSKETFKAFEQDVKLRSRRMQTFEPATWIKSRGYRHGLEVSEVSLNQIIEYKTGFPLSTLGRNNIVNISKPDGSYDANGLKSCATRYPITVRRDDKKKLIELMQKVGEVANGPDHAPVIIALWDNVGITHELTGYRNDATGWIEKYGYERELEIGALNAIEGVRKALRNKSRNNAISGFENSIFKWNKELTKLRLADYERENPKNFTGLARQMDLCERWERDAAARIPLSIARRREGYVRCNENEWKHEMAEIDKAASQTTTPDKKTGKTHVQKRDELIEKRASEAEINADQEWFKYETKLDMTALENFKIHYTEFLSTAAIVADNRTEDTVAWMRSANLQNSLLEFHPLNISDGTAFEDIVGDIIFGISSSPAGLTIIREWIAEEKISDGNLLWRAFAFNQADGADAVNGILATVAASKDVSFTESSFNAIRNNTKYIAKLADLVKKSLSLHNTLRKDGVHRFPTGGTEKILMTVGHLFFQPFIKKTTDVVAEKIILGLLLARAGAEYSKIMDLLVAESKFGKSARAETMLFFSLSHGVVTQRYEVLKEKWKALVETADTPKPNAKPQLAGTFNEAKELRFGMVATLFQMAYVAKLYLDAENHPENKRIKAELWVAGLTLSAGLADLGATGIKGLHDLKDAALGFQGLKLAGGLLSAGAAWVGTQQDYAEAKKKESEGKEALSILYKTKAFFTAAGGAASLLTSISYTKPAFDMIAIRFPRTLIGQASKILPQIGSRIAARLFIGRALLMFGGIWFSIATVAIQIMIWKFSGDDLQNWCERSAFGVNKSKRINNPKQQMVDFENSLMEVL